MPVGKHLSRGNALREHLPDDEKHSLSTVLKYFSQIQFPNAWFIYI